MRLLVCPVYEVPKRFDADSSWRLMRDLVAAADARGWFSYWITPSTAGDDKIARVDRLASDFSGSRRLDELRLPAPVVDRFTAPTAWPIDAVVTNNPLMGMTLQGYLQAVAMRKEAAVPLVVWNVSHMFFDSQEIIPLSTEEMAIWALGYCANDNLMCTQWALERCRDMVATYCGPELQDWFEKRTRVAYIGPDCAAIDNLRGPKFEKFSMYFGGRFTGTKGAEKAVDQYVRYVMGGRDAGIYVTHTGGARRLAQVTKRLGAQREITALEGAPWNEAMSMMARCHLSIFWQTLQMFPTSCYEQLYAGLVVLIRRTGVEDELLPPDYPFVFETALECATMLRWVAENLEEAQAKIAYVPAWVKERFDRPLAITATLDQVELKVRERREFLRRRSAQTDNTQDAVLRALKGVGDRATWDELAKALNVIKPNMLRKSMASTTTLRLAEVVQNWLPPQYADDCTQAEPRYVLTEAADG